MTLVIGLTGSIGTGKTLIANRCRKKGIPVVDADLIAREVVEQGKSAHEKIVATFGNEVLHEDGSLNRSALGAIVFNDAEKRQQLNDITHPEIRKEMIHQRDSFIAEGHQFVVLDIPLLYESNLTHFVEKIIVVFVDKDVQLKRIIARDELTEKEAKKRINTQISVAEKAKRADAVIDNNGTKESSYKQLDTILTTWTKK